MATFLQLVQDLHRECGAAGTAPTTVTGNVGEPDRLVQWIKEADMEIQNLWVNWKFLRDTSFSEDTTASTATMAGPSTLGYWDFETFRIDDELLDVVEYEQVKGEILDTTEGQPGRVIIMPDGSLKFEPVPDAAYTITADHFVDPATNIMSADGDVSAIPTQFHRAIVGQGLLYYANYENAPEAKVYAEEILGQYLPRLENSQLPNFQYSRFNPGNYRIEVIAE